MTHHKGRNRESLKATLDNFSEAPVRPIVNEFCGTDTIEKIHTKSKHTTDVEGNISTLWKILSTLRFGKILTKCSPQILIELRNKRAQRISQQGLEIQE